MKQNRKIFFSYILLIGFLIPISVNFAHSFETHEHITCHAKDVKHFHQLEKDCSSFHYTIQSFVYRVTYHHFIFSKKISTEVLQKNTSNYLGIAISLQGSRAPPNL